MPRRISILELRDLLLELRKGESIKSIHRSSGRHKTVIRALKELSEHEDWLNAATGVPTEAEIQAVWNTRLKLSGMMDSLQLRFDQAVQEKWSFSDFLERLLQDEVERRDSRQLSRRLIKSGLAAEKTLETFNFSFNPTVHEPSIREIALCNFMKDHENVFFVGPSGIGKSHLVQAVGHEAVRRGYEVLFRRTAPLFRWVNAGHDDGSRLRRLKSVIAVPLLILDDFGLQSLSEDEQNDLYEVLCERYEKASTIITSNRDFGEWPSVFSNPLMSSAAMDRLVHHAVKFVIEGKSYRVESFSARQRSLTAGV